MRKNKIVMACFVSVVSSTLWAAPSAPSKPSTPSTPATPSMTTVYEKRCANCHGDTANGVSKLQDKKDIAVKDMAGAGVASGKENNIHGSPLNHLSEEELVKKLQNFRNEDFNANSPTSAMRENLKRIEKRDGVISDEKLAEYIYNTFGPGKR